MNFLRLKLHALVTRLMTNPDFAKQASRFWPTRRIAQHQASQLFDVVSGFVYSQILFAAVKLRLFELLRQKPLSIEDISQQTGLNITAANRLLKGTTSLQLTKELPGPSFGLGKLGASLVANPGLVEMVEHHEMFYRDLTDPLALLTDPDSTQLGQFWSYAKTTDLTEADTSSEDEVHAYSELMKASQPMVAEQVLQSYSFDSYNKLLDLGGGTGQFLKAIRSNYAQLELELFDLPSVHSITEQNELEQHRIQATGGDFFQSPLPTGADIISLVRILHDHNDNAVELLLSRVFSALPDKGTILIAEPLADTPGAKRIGHAYFNFYFLAMGKGEPRSNQRLTEMLKTAGFTDIQQHRTPIPLICSVIAAKKG